MSVFNGLSRPCCWGAVAIAGLMIAGPQPAVAIQAGINVDIHQDINQVASLPNGFYIWGRLESGVPLGMPGGGSWSRPPVLLEHIDGYPPNVFPNFAYNISPDLTMPGQNWYTFWARWSYPSGTHYIPYCQVYHIGVLFDLVCHNVVIDAQGRWERNGSPVTVGLNQGFVPAPGFRVDDQVDTQFIRIQNGDADGLMEPGEIEGAIVQMDLVSIPSREELEMLLGTDPFRELHLGGLQSSLPWVPVMQDMDPISELNPVDFWPDSFFDVFLEVT